jgi:hypothetical protein
VDIQGTFRQKLGTFGHKQGTFRQQQGTLRQNREHSDKTRKYSDTYREQGLDSGNIQGTFREHSGEISGSIQGAFREHSGKFQWTFRELPGNIQRRCLPLFRICVRLLSLSPPALLEIPHRLRAYNGSTKIRRVFRMGGVLSCTPGGRTKGVFVMGLLMCSGVTECRNDTVHKMCPPLLIPPPRVLPAKDNSAHQRR